MADGVVGAQLPVHCFGFARQACAAEDDGSRRGVCEPAAWLLMMSAVRA